ncbi:MAG: hypothetical protein ACTSO9_09925 [Candidatus Helarchaeota archaeon]
MSTKFELKKKYLNNFIKNLNGNNEKEAIKKLIFDLIETHFKIYNLVSVERYNKFITNIRIDIRLRLYGPNLILFEIRKLIFEKLNIKSVVENQNRNAGCLVFHKKSALKILKFCKHPQYEFLNNLCRICKSFKYKHLADEEIELILNCSQ